LIKQKNPLHKYYGQAINYRFLKDEKGFRVFITITIEESNWITKKENGIIGIDINYNHLAIVETDRYLNPIKSKRISLSTYGKNKNQALAIIADASVKIITQAIETKKPIVIEELDFQKKKTTLKETSKKYARLLSSFSYKTIINILKSKAFKSKVEIFEVNPAFTSVIGKIKFQKRYGLTAHQAAALTIARRYMNFSEKPPAKSIILNAKGSMRAFFLPVRNRKKHLWTFWGKVFGILKAVDAPHYRATNSRSSGTHMSTCEIETPGNYERDSHTLMFVDKTARSTSLKKSLLHV
ncbi:MAG: IS200/IS605 family accessory protein TnpB-related protein, partial [Parachlamydiales bacterium]|nr:IS200/IS605 family accessory protein TnpB-related protein [Parachlamydiales bacterium]